MVSLPVTRVSWLRTHRIIRSVFPPISLFEDIADPGDWDVLAAAETKSNPRLAETMGRLDLVPAGRRVAGPGASLVMAPFTHVSKDRPSRFSDGSFGVYYAGNTLETALAETVHHHERFMARTREEPGWTSQFRQLVGQIDAMLHDLRDLPGSAPYLDADSYAASQALARTLRQDGSDGIVYPSLRYAGGECIAAFWPDIVSIPVQADHFAYHWNGTRVDFIRNESRGEDFQVS